MFSDTYFVEEKYNLNTGEYISTTEAMPWRFTSLYDSQYLPVFDETVANKLNSFFNYRYIHSTEPHYIHEKYLYIEHVNGEILKYDLANPTRYYTANSTIQTWKHFVSTIDCLELDLCKSKIDKMTDITDAAVTRLTRIAYNPDLSLSHVTVYDDSYNDASYSDNSGLSKLNSFCASFPNSKIRGIVKVYPNKESLGFRVSANYPKVIVMPQYDTATGNLMTPNRIPKVYDGTDNRKDIFIKKLISQDLITEEQEATIREKTIGKTKFALEYEIDETGKYTDIFLIIVKVFEFKDLTTA